MDPRELRLDHFCVEFDLTARDDVEHRFGRRRGQCADVRVAPADKAIFGRGHFGVGEAPFEPTTLRLNLPLFGLSKL